MAEISIGQLRNETSRLIDRVEHGEVLTVTRHGRPVARIVPVEGTPGLAKLVETGRIRWSGRKPVLPTPVALTGDGRTAAEIVAEDRGPGGAPDRRPPAP